MKLLAYLAGRVPINSRRWRLIVRVAVVVFYARRLRHRIAGLTPRERASAATTLSDCPYCDGDGCSECHGTGERHTTFVDAGDGMTGTVHGNAALSPESLDAIAAVIRAAHAVHAEKPECTCAQTEASMWLCPLHGADGPEQ